MSAARWTTARREELLADRQGIAFETVFSAPDKVDFVARAKEAGYFVRIFFISTSDPRIEERASFDSALAGARASLRTNGGDDRPDPFALSEAAKRPSRSARGGIRSR